MAKKTLHPGRTLLIFGLAIVLLYGLAALGQTWKPRLGLDLEGGTRITLSAIPQGGAITQTKLKQAASIVDARVNGTGVSEAEVSTQGNRNIIVEIPGKNASNLVDAVKRTAQLRFRLVAGQPQPGTPPARVQQLGPAEHRRRSPSTTPKPRQGRKGRPPSRVPPRSPSPRRPRPLQHRRPPPSRSSPQLTEKGAPVSKPLEWSKNPGTRWLKKYAAYTCPTKKNAAAEVKDVASRPLITCDKDGLKFLLSAAVIEGTNLKSASYGTPQNGVGWVVNLGLKGEAKKAMADTSTALNQSGGTFAIVLDGQVISYAGFNEPILDGNAQISGDFKRVRGTLARQLAEVRRAAAEVRHHDRDDRALPRRAASSPRASSPASSAC